MPSEIITKCSALIASRGWNIAFVESATAGRLCSEFALTPDSGKILRGGISCYEVFVKEQILNIPHKLIELYTPESEEVTAALAHQGAKFFNSKITVAITGLTTPGGSEAPEKPVGTMFLNIRTPLGIIADKTIFKGAPEQIILQASDRAAQLIYQQLKNNYK